MSWRRAACRLLCRDYPEVIAYGAGWTDPARQQPVGDTGRHERRHVDAIVAAELDRALDDSGPLRGIAQLVARWAAVFAVDPDAVTAPRPSAPSGWPASCATRCQPPTRRCAPPPGPSFAPSFSPRLTELHRDAFVPDPGISSTVDLDAHRADSGLDAVDLGDEDADAA